MKQRRRKKAQMHSWSCVCVCVLFSFYWVLLCSLLVLFILGFQKPNENCNDIIKGRDLFLILILFIKWFFVTKGNFPADLSKRKNRIFKYTHFHGVLSIESEWVRENWLPCMKLHPCHWGRTLANIYTYTTEMYITFIPC